MTWRILHGDCRELLPELWQWYRASIRAQSWIGGPRQFSSCVTDPPYGLSFMGRDWDSPDNVAFRPETWRLVLQVLKPGAYLVAFGGTRKFHRLMVAIEDAGFVLRDTVMWMYGQGMPKSHDVSKAIDRAAGAEREVVRTPMGPTGNKYCKGLGDGRPWMAEAAERGYHEHAGPEPVTDAAKQWDGYGTALSPSWEPIVLAQKPISGTIAGNVLKHGVGALNIDGCRLPTTDDTGRANSGSLGKNCFSHRDKCDTYTHPAGRWPPNVALDEAASRLVDEQSGERPGGGNINTTRRVGSLFGAGGIDKTVPRQAMGDTGGASRFFYCPKASTAERNAGLGDEQNTHPTVKPIALMRWLCRLVTPPGQAVIDPFAGSGSTGAAAVLEGLPFTGLEQDAEAVRIARLRIHHRQPNSAEVADVAPPKARQGSLF